eukprot:NODE_1954_length_1552_cov_159.219734_g1861_i0.p1 GENE.NODE_1954_length_1552_cov_159.219734_g1861_i0~~NODE_1954_length_1552_cov_159.219734_g1861_i0.p1  ORF type:complete len:480 (+),score=97.45 NODE_1954_length_1552_cov_159.219734_g1861_i0:75-1514(+)
MLRVCLAALCLCSVVAVEQVHLGPGLTPSDINVGWVTIYNATAGKSHYVQYGRSPVALTMHRNGTTTTFLEGSKTRNITMHLAQITGLVPETRYYYRVTSNEASSEVFSFKTLPKQMAMPSDGKPLSLIVFGDMGFGNAQSLHGIIRDVRTGNWDLGLGIGDYAYDMHDHAGKQADNYFRTTQPIYAELPFITTPGNHEWEYNFQHYTFRFNTNPVNTGRLPKIAGSYVAGQPNNWYFSYVVGKVQFLSISSELWWYANATMKPAMLQWLEKELQHAQSVRKQVPWVILFLHRSVYCSCDTDCDQDAVTVRTDLEPLLFKYGVDFLINAHEHNYERLYAVHNDKYVSGHGSLVQSPGATVYVITGDAGNGEGHEPFTRPQPKWSAFRSNTFGYSRMKIYNDTHMYWEQVMTDHGEPPEDYGKVIDHFWLVQPNHGPFKAEVNTTHEKDAPRAQYLSRMTGKDGPGHKTASLMKKQNARV